MTDTSGKDIEILPVDVDYVIDRLNYEGCDPGHEILLGPEIEFFVCRFDGDDKIRPLTLDEANLLKNAYKKKTGDALHQEAIASHFEVNLGPTGLKGFSGYMEDGYRKLGNFFETVESLGFRVIPTSHAPHIVGVDDIRPQLLWERNRIHAIIPNAERLLGSEIVKYANTTCGIHVSSGYRDVDHFYTDLRRSYYLSPFVYAVTNNGFPFWNGFRDAKGVNPRLASIELEAKTKNGRTGVDPLFLQAADGEDFIRQYVERILYSPVFGYYDPADAELDEVPINDISVLEKDLGRAVTFADLADLKGRNGDPLNTIANYSFAASTWWYGVKIQDIPGVCCDNGKPAKRLEDRHGNGGPWQLPVMLLTRSLMTLDEDCGREVDALLERQGFHKAGPAIVPQSGMYLREAMDHACNEGNKGLSIPFGKGSMHDFALEYLAIMEKFASKYGLSDNLKPLAEIIKRNMTDAQVYASAMQKPEDAIHFIHDYDRRQIMDPHRSLIMSATQDNQLLLFTHKAPGSSRKP